MDRITAEKAWEFVQWVKTSPKNGEKQLAPKEQAHLIREVLKHPPFPCTHAAQTVLNEEAQKLELTS